MRQHEPDPVYETTWASGANDERLGPSLVDGHDDLLEFHELLRRDDWFQRLAAADEDGDLV